MTSQLSSAKIERGSRSKLNLLHDSDFGITNKKEINEIMADFVKNDKRNNNGRKNFNRNNNRKVKDYGSKKETTIPAPEVCAGVVEYTMSKTMADEIIQASKSSKTPQEILCEYVNSQMGLKGYCIKVLVDIN
jgi:hypothetical protein